MSLVYRRCCMPDRAVEVELCMCCGGEFILVLRRVSLDFGVERVVM